jgi:hypothetical protein
MAVACLRCDNVALEPCDAVLFDPELREFLRRFAELVEP